MFPPDDEILFDVLTPLGFTVHCTLSYWLRKILTDHPVMGDRLETVKHALYDPDEIRLSRSDDPRLVCAVARQTGTEGFLITAYPTDKIKQGETVWKR